MCTFINKLFVPLMLVGLVGLSGCDNEKTVRFAAGNAGGNYYSLATDLQAMESEKKDGITIRVKETAGSAANIRLIDQGFADMAFVQGDLKSALTPKTRVLGELYTEVVQVVVKADSDIRSVYDLNGKKVSVGEKESGVLENAIMMLDGCNMSLADLIVCNYSFAQAAQALLEGEIDAFFCTAGIPTNSVLELSKMMPVRLVSTDSNGIDYIMHRYADRNIINVAIPAGVYNGQTEEVSNTFGSKVMLVCSTDFDETMANSIFEDFKKNPDLIKKYSVME